jgi:non-heme chloroperoxidase
MSTVTTSDGTSLYYKDWGTGETLILSHGWPLSSDAWDQQLLFLANRGYRVIAADRRGHGRSGQPWTGYDNDTFADDLACLIENLAVDKVSLIAHCMGGGEVARYVSRHGTSKIRSIIFIAAVPPIMVKRKDNPLGLPLSVFEDLRAGLANNRSRLYMNISFPFYGYGRSVSEGEDAIRQQFCRLGMQSSIKASFECIKAFSEEDFTADLEKIDVPTLFIHGEADQIVPLESSSLRATEIVKHSKLRLIKDGPHGLCTTHPNVINHEILSFLQQ